MAIYLDASVLVALLGSEPASKSVTAWLEASEDALIVSDFAKAESSAALSRQRRVGALSIDHANEAFTRLDAWTARYAEAAEIDRSDVAIATQWVRRPDFALRAPDAIHLAAARRLQVTLVTLDDGQAAAAHALNIACINPADHLPA